MARCPFGFTGEEMADDEAGEVEEQEPLDATNEQAKANQLPPPRSKKEPSSKAAATEAHDSSPSKRVKKAAGKKEPGTMDPDFDLGSDPIAWLASQAIKSEADFQTRKDTLRELARKRLDQLMDKQNQRNMWPSDSEFDDMTISSGEISELDSDVHSLASVRSCAYSWIAKAKYQMMAETATRWAATGVLALAFVLLYWTTSGMLALRPIFGIVKNSSWPGYMFLTALGLAGAAGCLLLAANWRSRRLLLAAQVCTIIVYGGAVLLAVAICFMPTEVDARMQRAMCSRWSDARSTALGNDLPVPPPPAGPLCEKLPVLQQTVSKSTWGLRALAILQALACLGMFGVATWYLFELCYIDKRGAKHARRHKRSKFTIPWDKIKVLQKEGDDMTGRTEVPVVDGGGKDKNA